ncbi:MAG: HAD family hydrolase [Saprospiraceae bacterium]|nr:HAD family hydrolase [Saprospiraceae bacterium]
MHLIIFDLDGTLVHSDRRDSNYFAQAYETIYQRPFPTIDWTRYPHVTDTSIFQSVVAQHFERSTTPEETTVFQQYYMDLLEEGRRQMPDHFQTIPGAPAMMARLHDMPDQYHTCLATGGWHAPAKIKLQHVSLLTDRLPIHAADGKITRESILSEAIETAGGADKFAKIVYIGDAEWDVTTTRNMQLDFVGIRWRGDREVLREAGATQVIENFLDLEAFFQALHLATPPAELQEYVKKLSFEDCA